MVGVIPISQWRPMLQHIGAGQLSQGRGLPGGQCPPPAPAPLPPPPALVRCNAGGEPLFKQALRAGAASGTMG